VKCKGHNFFFQIDTCLGSDLSTLMENRNRFQISENFCAKSSFKPTCLKQTEISIMVIPLLKSPVVTSFLSFLPFYGDKDNHTIFYLCVQHGWVGGHWSSLRKFYGRNHDLVDRYIISMLQMTTIYYTCRKHFPVLSSFMTYLSILILKNRILKYTKIRE
jgi:hypothetical protein